MIKVSCFVSICVNILLVVVLNACSSSSSGTGSSGTGSGARADEVHFAKYYSIYDSGYKVSYAIEPQSGQEDISSLVRVTAQGDVFVKKNLSMNIEIKIRQTIKNKSDDAVLYGLQSDGSNTGDLTTLSIAHARIGKQGVVHASLHWTKMNLDKPISIEPVAVKLGDIALIICPNTTQSDLLLYRNYWVTREGADACSLDNMHGANPIAGTDARRASTMPVHRSIAGCLTIPASGSSIPIETASEILDSSVVFTRGSVYFIQALGPAVTATATAMDEAAARTQASFFPPDYAAAGLTEIMCNERGLRFGFRIQ